MSHYNKNYASTSYNSYNNEYSSDPFGNQYFHFGFGVDTGLKAELGLTDLSSPLYSNENKSSYEELDKQKGPLHEFKAKVSSKSEMSPTLGRGFDDSPIPDQSVFSPTNSNSNRRRNAY